MVFRALFSSLGGTGGPFVPFASTRHLKLLTLIPPILATAPTLGLEAENAETVNLQFDLAAQILIQILLDQNSKVLHKELLRLFDVLSGFNRAPLAKPTIAPFFSSRFELLFKELLVKFVDRVSEVIADEEGASFQTGGRLEDAAAVDSLTVYRMSSEYFAQRRGDVFKYFVSMLEHIAALATQEDALVTWTEAEASNCEFVLVALVQLLRVHSLNVEVQKNLVDLYASSGRKPEPGDPAKDLLLCWRSLGTDSSLRSHSTFALVGRAIWTLMDLVTSPVCSKDATYTTGFLLALQGKLLISSAAAVSGASESWCQDQLISSLLSQHAKKDAGFPSSIFDTVIHIGSVLSGESHSYLSMNTFFFSECHPQAQICILRGVVVAFASDSNGIKLIAKPSSSLTITNGSLLYEGILPELFKFSEKNSERYIRFLAFRGIDSSLEEAGNALKHASIVEGLREKTIALLHNTMDLIMRNWEDPFDAINNQIKSIFKLVLILNDACAEAFGQPAAGDPQDFGLVWLQNLTQKLLDLDWRKKGKYSILVILLDRLGTKTILALQSGSNFLERVLEAMSFMSVGKQASMLLELFLKALKEDLESNNVSLSAEKAFEIFLPPLIKALFNDDVFKDVVVYGVPLTLEMFPDCLPAFLRQVCDFKFGDTVGLSLRHARALIAVIKMGRKLGKLMGYQMETCLEDFGCKYTSKQVAEIAITTSDEEIRFDALSLLMTSRRSTEPVSLFELDNAIRFLHYSSFPHLHPFPDAVDKSSSFAHL